MSPIWRMLIQPVVFLVVAVLGTEGDLQVNCVFGGSCVLPCKFQPNNDTLLHWVKLNGEKIRVHSYYKKQDQLEHQDPLYKARTSLFLDQISVGNASLRLTRVNLQDQGRYVCHASTSEENQETFVTLTVTAPVARVDIVLVNNTVTCKSGGIYPRPQLTWSISPHPATVLQNTTNVHEDDQGLYDISSSLRTVYNDTESTYNCSVQNEHSARKITIRKHSPIQSAPESEVLLPCNSSDLYDITWTFNQSQTILRRQAGQEKPQVETEWQQHVRELSESGSLLLNVTSSAKSAGTYRCVLSHADETHVTHIELKILEDPIEVEPSHQWIVALVIALVAMLKYLKLKGCCSTPRVQPDQPTEMNLVKVSIGEEINPGESSPLTEPDGRAETAHAPSRETMLTT